MLRAKYTYTERNRIRGIGFFHATTEWAGLPWPSQADHAELPDL